MIGYSRCIQSFKLMCTEHPHTTLTTVNGITLLLQLLWQRTQCVICAHNTPPLCNMLYGYVIIHLSFGLKVLHAQLLHVC
jgi:hypothetical protein